MFAADGEKLTVWIEPARARDDELMLRRWNMAMQNRAVTVNEFRTHILNLPPVEDPAADELPDGPGGLTPGVKAIADRLNPYTMRRLDAAADATAK